MINLLPTAQKKRLQKESRMRLLVVILCAMLFLEVALAAAFLPTYFTRSAVTIELRAAVEKKKQELPQVETDVESKLKAIQSEIALLKISDAPSDEAPTQLLEEILERKPQGILINSVAYTHKTTGAQGSIFLLSGNADRREDLLFFQRSLREHTKFADVRYNQNFITMKTDIDFQLTVTTQP